ncbi:MAG: copper chaperone PCu(A)C [Hyphomicrobiaceae bacterium]
MKIPAWRIWCLVIAIAVRAFVPSGYMLASPDETSSLPHIVICTANGAKQVKLDGDGQQAPGHSKGDSGVCPFSTPSMASVLLPPPMLPPKQPVRSWQVWTTPTSIIPGHTHAWLARAPRRRAPPRGPHTTAAFAHLHLHAGPLARQSGASRQRITTSRHGTHPMNTTVAVRRTLSFCVALCALAFLTPVLAQAQDYTVGALKISAPWARATPAGAQVAGGFMTIENTGKESDVLVGGTFTRSGRVEIHEMAVVNDIMKMHELPNGLEIKPGEKVTLKPGSYHVMFMELKQPLQQGDTVDGTLVFKKAGTVKVSYKVGTMGMKMQGHGAHGGKH